MWSGNKLRAIKGLGQTLTVVISSLYSSDIYVNWHQRCGIKQDRINKTPIQRNKPQFVLQPFKIHEINLKNSNCIAQNSGNHEKKKDEKSQALKLIIQKRQRISWTNSASFNVLLLKSTGRKSGPTDSRNDLPMLFKALPKALMKELSLETLVSYERAVRYLRFMAITS